MVGGGDGVSAVVEDDADEYDGVGPKVDPCYV